VAAYRRHPSSNRTGQARIPAKAGAPEKRPQQRAPQEEAAAYKLWRRKAGHVHTCFTE